MRGLAEAWRDRAGSSLVEAGIAMPFVVMLGIGVIEYGHALHAHHQAATGVRDAARFLARQHEPEAAEAAARLLATTGSITGGEARVAGWSIEDIVIGYRSLPNPIDAQTGERTYRGGDPIRMVEVATTFSIEGLGGLSLLGGSTAVTLSVSHEERLIGE